MLSAAALLEVLQDRGRVARTGAYECCDQASPGGDGPVGGSRLPNFTAVDVATLRDAIAATQAIRHARDAGEGSAEAITKAHVTALRELDHHPALFALTDEMIDRAQRGVADNAAAERDRARKYWNALGSGEQRGGSRSTTRRITRGRARTPRAKCATVRSAGSTCSLPRSSTASLTRSASAHVSRAAPTGPGASPTSSLRRPPAAIERDD